LAAGEARFNELFRMVGEARTDAREARDTSKRIEAILEQQDIGGALAQARAEAKASTEALRQDVVAANTTLKKDVVAACERIEKLEDARNKVVGVAEFFQWLAKTGPWLLALGAAVWAGTTGKGS
jgi:hypothetical protein